MNIPRYQARAGHAKPANDDMSTDYEVLAGGQVILADVPQGIVIDVVEALNQAYASGLEDAQ